MAELVALGFAANIGQFLELTVKLFRKSKELYDSAEGGEANQLELEEVTKNLARLTENLILQSSVRLAEQDDIELGKISENCQVLARQLLKKLDKMKVKKEKKGKKLASIEQAWKNVWNEKDIKDMEARLERYRGELNQHLLYMLSDRQSQVLEAIEHLGSKSTQELNELTVKLLRQADASRSMNYAFIEINLRKIADEWLNIQKRQKILDSLLFSSYQERYDSIKEAHANTFDWVFEDINPTSSLGPWLESEHGIYWVQGKAGSGKSTFMRYLSKHDRTIQALERWANGYRLFTGHHFFWHAGTPMQKSQAGLLQTLLYQVFEQCPDLIESICKTRWRGSDTVASAPWNLTDLRAAFLKLSNTNMASSRFCFFIDGLDEYHGGEHQDREHYELVALLNTLSASYLFKLCVSSRPWNPFLKAFGARPGLKLEYLTARDIETYVRDLLGKDQMFRECQAQNPRYNRLIEDICKKAEGVFLWVFLVIRDLLRGLENGDYISEMQSRLVRIPGDLKGYFEQSFQNIDERYRQQSVRCFEIATKALQPLPVLAFYLLEREIGDEVEKGDEDYAFGYSDEPLSSQELEKMHQNMELRLNARCQDLLEVVKDNSTSESIPQIYRHKVTFLHRTVKEFFLDKDSMQSLRKILPYFDSQLSLCKIMVAISQRLEYQQKDLFKDNPLAFSISNYMFALSDELIYHSRCIEKEENGNLEGIRLMKVVGLLDELDRTNIKQLLRIGEKQHWSNLPRVPWGKSTVSFSGSKHKTFLALAIQAKLGFYVKEKLDEPLRQKKEFAKDGRPLLDYALRPNIQASVKVLESSDMPDFEMVSLLLRYNADPNQKVKLYQDQRVFVLFIRSCYQISKDRGFSGNEAREIYSIIELLVGKGAKFDCGFEDEGRMVTAASALNAFLTRTQIHQLESLREAQKGFGIQKFMGLLFGR